MLGREGGGQRERKIDGKRERKRKRHRAAGEGGGGKGNKQMGGLRGEREEIEHGKYAEISALKGLGLPWFPKLQTKLCRAAPGSLGFKAGGGEFLLWLRGSEPD